ncbi:MAG: lysine--tRNA ligase [Candidatus Sungbacteria bacterium]|nr:lysine--tRNA ligase [Candidatus Sungbacteria bacterium]
MALEDIRNERVRKRATLFEQGVNPYPAQTRRTHTIGELLKKFSVLSAAGKKVAAAGRVMAKREHGGAAFFDVQDESGKIQILIKHDTFGDGQYEAMLAAVDIGDFVSAEGMLFETKRGEKTIETKQWAMLGKSLLPLPEKWHGLQDVEERFRKRYLDLIMNEEVRERFVTRAKIISFIRQFHEKHGFLEVETPMLHPIPGGTLAKPFVTHQHALDIDLYLRIAPELYLKRLLVAGYEKVFEIGKSFRNEGIDTTHNPEFTEPESYAAYWDEEDMMTFVEDLFIGLAKALGKKEMDADGRKIVFHKPFNRIAFKDLLARYALIPDYEAETRDSLAARARQLGIDAPMHASKGKIADEIYKKICRPYLVQPTFLTHHPIEISPLSKKWEDHPNEVRRFQLVVAGWELTNAFAELNDPIDQRERFEEQERERAGGEDEAMRLDEDFLEAMEHGMPPAAGLGIGVDRVVMLFTNTKNIREVVLFPTMRPKPEDKD